MRLHAERIDAAHIREPALADVINQIVLNFQVIRHIIGVPPNPAGRNAGIKPVVNLVLCYFAVSRVDEQNADGVVENPAVFVNVIVRHGDVLRNSRVVRLHIAALDKNGGAADVIKQTAFHRTVFGVQADFYPGSADILKRTARKRHAFGVRGKNRRRDAVGGLGIFELARDDVPFAAGEGDALKTDAVDAVDFHHCFERPGVQHGCFKGIRRERNIVQFARRPVKIPFARLGKGLEDILKEITVALLNGHRRGFAQAEIPCGRVIAFDGYEIILPIMKDAHIHIPEIFEQKQVLRVRVEGGIGFKIGAFRLELVVVVDGRHRKLPRLGITRARQPLVAVVQRVKKPFAGIDGRRPDGDAVHGFSRPAGKRL